MKDLIVFTGSSIPASDPASGTLSLYLDQLAKAGIESYVRTMNPADLDQCEGGAMGTLANFISIMRETAQTFSNYERIVATDAWDVLFFGSKEDVIRKIPMDKCLIGAAKECYPWGLAAREPTSEDTVWMYANGGLLAGTPENIRKLVDTMEAHPSYRPRLENQGMENIMLAEKSDAFYHDSRTDLFFCLFDGYPELDFERSLPVNTLCGTRPQFIHSNGHWPTDEMWAKYKASLKEEV
jgi:hypothetical protein